MQWEKFTKPRKSSYEKIYAALNSEGRIYLNRLAYEKLGRPAFVELLFDKRMNVIGIAPSTESKSSAIPVRDKQRQTSLGRVIYASDFCKHFNIRPKGTLGFHDVSIDTEGIMRLDMHHAVESKR